jgi:anti-sigma factor RsiW
MTHLDDGRLRALLDEELGDADTSAVRLHLAECDTCRDRKTELEARSALVAQALGRLDTAAPPVGGHAALLERIDRAPPKTGSAPPTRFRRVFRMPLARAAILALLLGAGVATALPASPVRGWIAAGWARATELFDSGDDAPVAPTVEAPSGTPDGRVGAQDSAPAMVRFDATGQEVSIVLREIGPGTLIVILMVPGGQVGVSASDPASFRTAEGRIEVTGAVGQVLVDLPEEASVVSIEVNDRMYLRKEGDRIDAPGPIEEQTEGEYRMRVP